MAVYHGMEKVVKVQEVLNGKFSVIRQRRAPHKKAKKVEVEALVKELKRVARVQLVHLR